MTPAVSLASRAHRETDKLTVLYTEEFGKLWARFGGVNRPEGKLKAISEPMVFGEYRLYTRDGADFVTAAGGSLTTTFPGLRRSLSQTLRGLEVCELMERLTPMWKPNPSKLELVVETLSLMETAGSRGGPWLLSAFTLRLLDLAGFGLRARRVSEKNRQLWKSLHDAPLSEIAGLPSEPALESRLGGWLRNTVERVSERPLRAVAVRERIFV